MTIRTFYPPEIFQFMYNIALEENLSVKEVETVFLRYMCQSLGYVCDHTEHIGYAKKTKKRYCKSCWTRLEMEEFVGYENGHIVKGTKYKPLETFLDKWLKEQKAKAKIEGKQYSRCS